MNVVCHQAVAEQPYAVLPAPLRKCLEIESPVFVAQEDVLTIVAPLGDVVWNALHDHTGHPRHWNVRIIAEFGGCPSSPLISLSSPPHLLLISSSSPSSPHLSPHLLISPSSLTSSLTSSLLISPHLSSSPSSLLISPHLSSFRPSSFPSERFEIGQEKTNRQLIAAHALALGVILVTNKAREFRRVRGLRVENWA